MTPTDATAPITASSAATPGPARHREGGWFGTRVLNGAVAGMARLGFSLDGAWTLDVVGRSSGEVRSVPVNPLELDGVTYLVAPRGHTQWVRNLRVAERGVLRLGRRQREFTAVEVADADKAPMLRAYMQRWGRVVESMVDGLSADMTDHEITAIAAGYPVFAIE